MKPRKRKTPPPRSVTRADMQPVTRILGPGEPVGIAGGNGNEPKPHWSACPKCGQSKLSIMGRTPVCSHTVGRIRGYIQKYMRCRDCGTTYTALQPD